MHKFITEKVLPNKKIYSIVTFEGPLAYSFQQLGKGGWRKKDVVSVGHILDCVIVKSSWCKETVYIFYASLSFIFTN